MLKKRHAILGLIWMLLVVLFAGCVKKDPVVAKVGKKTEITFGEFEDYYYTVKRGREIKAEDPEKLRGYLDEMIDHEILLLEAYQKGFDRDSVVVARAKEKQKELMLSRLYDMEIMDKLFPESYLRDYYARTGKEFMLRKIVLNVPDSAKYEDEEKIRNRGKEALEKYRSGEGFAELAREYSDDRKTRKAGGIVGPIQWTHSDDPIMKRAFSMKKGEISDLMKIDRDYYIIYIEEVRELERESYKNSRQKILEDLQRKNRSAMDDEVNHFRERLKVKLDMTWNNAVVDTMFARFKDLGVLRKREVLDLLDSLFTGEETFLTYRGGRLTTQEFRDRLDDQSSNRQRFDFSDKEQIKTVSFNLLFLDLLMEVAERKSLDKDSFVVNGVRRQSEAEMIRQLRDKEIYGEIDPSDEELTDYYQKQIGGKERYVVPAKIQIQEVLVKDKDLADKIYSWAKNGRSFDELAKKYTTREGYKAKKGIFKHFPKGKWGNLGEAAFKLNIGQIGGPIKLEKNLGYTIFKVLDKKPDRIKKFEEVKKRVTRDLIAQIRKEKEDAWQREQRKLYQVIAYEDIFQEMIQDDSIEKTTT